MVQKTGMLVGHLEKLPYFLEIARWGSFRRASESLRIAQPSLSKAIAVLEAACGARLFDRQPRGTTLTAEGERLVLTATAILRAAAAFEAGEAEGGGQARLGFVTHELLVPLLAPGLSPETDHLPGIAIKTDPSVGKLVALIEEGAADAGVLAASPPRQGLVQRSLFVDHYAFACAPSFAKVMLSQLSQPLRPDDLAKLPLIYAPDVLAGTHETLEVRLGRLGLDLAPKHVVTSIESVAALAASGFGVGIMPLALARAHVRGRLVEIRTKLAVRGPLARMEFFFTCRQESWTGDERVRRLHNATRSALAALDKVKR